MLRELVAMLDQVDVSAIRPPTDDLKAGDWAIGELPDDLKPLFGLLQQLCDQYRAVEAVNAVGQPESGAGESAETTETESLLLYNQAELVGRAFWFAVRRAFPDYVLTRRFALRKDWQVVVVGNLRSPIAIVFG